MTTRQTQITRSTITYGTGASTSVRVEVFAVIAAGIRQREASIDITLAGALDQPEALRAATRARLLEAGLIGADDPVWFEHEARAAGLTS
jgi:hypothetical protein